MHDQSDIAKKILDFLAEHEKQQDNIVNFHPYGYLINKISKFIIEAQIEHLNETIGDLRDDEASLVFNNEEEDE